MKAESVNISIVKDFKEMSFKKKSFLQKSIYKS